MRRRATTRACGLAWLATTLALDAKWAPAGDGPARFSKRYRDQAGIGALTTQYASGSAAALTFHTVLANGVLTLLGRRLAVDQ